MTIHKPVLRTLVLSCCIAAASAFAADPDGVPDHTLNSIRLTVRSGEAVMVATVLEDPATAPGAKVRFKVDQTLLGTLPTELEVPVQGFYVGDLQKGAQFLIALKFQRKQNQWVGSGLYDLISEGKIRDIPLATYLSRVTTETERLATERARRDEARAAAARLLSNLPDGTQASVQPGT
jgi:hypothetical protein